MTVVWHGLPTETMKPKPTEPCLQRLEENNCQSRIVLSEIFSFKNDKKNIFAKQKLKQFTFNRLLAKELLKDEHPKKRKWSKKTLWNRRRNIELKCSGKERILRQEKKGRQESWGRGEETLCKSQKKCLIWCFIMFLQCGMYYKFLNSHNTFSKVYDSLAYFIKLNLFLQLGLRARYMSSMYVRQEQS